MTMTGTMTGSLMMLMFLLCVLIPQCPAPGIDRAGNEKIDKIYGDIDSMDPKKVSLYSPILLKLFTIKVIKRF